MAMVCELWERSRVGSAAAGLGVQLRALAVGEDRPSIQHCGQLNTSIVSGPSLKGWERRWGAGRAEWREVGGRRREGCTTVYLMRGKSERGKSKV